MPPRPSSRTIAEQLRRGVGDRLLQERASARMRREERQHLAPNCGVVGGFRGHEARDA
jgi:hypothetical protein